MVMGLEKSPLFQLFNDEHCVLRVETCVTKPVVVVFIVVYSELRVVTWETKPPEPETVVSKVVILPVAPLIAELTAEVRGTELSLGPIEVAILVILFDEGSVKDGIVKSLVVTPLGCVIESPPVPKFWNKPTFPVFV